MFKNSKVYFLGLNQLEKIFNLLPKFKAPLGVKLHFGEQGNTTFVPASLIKPIVDILNKPSLIECSVLYKSPRSTASGHRQVALDHGFNFAPIDFLDGEEGSDSMEVAIAGKHFNTTYLGKNLAKYNSLLVLSHFKGHASAGFGGALKNLGMGLASRRGKLALHASIKHQVNQELCISCGSCLENCPVNAIKFNDKNKAEINQTICLSCSECISVCPVNAIEVPWESTSPHLFGERIAEYALAATLNRQCFYINFLINITDLCDCRDSGLTILTPDIGILVSADPVAIDQASFDLVIKQYPAFKDFNGEYQLEHGQNLGLGSRKYQLIKL